MDIIKCTHVSPANGRLLLLCRSAAATDNLPAVRLGRSVQEGEIEEEGNASAAAAHNLLGMSLARARSGAEVCMHARDSLAPRQ